MAYKNPQSGYCNYKVLLYIWSVNDKDIIIQYHPIKEVGIGVGVLITIEILSGRVVLE